MIRISRMIDELEAIRAQHGDLPITTTDRETGGQMEADSPAVEDSEQDFNQKVVVIR